MLIMSLAAWRRREGVTLEDLAGRLRLRRTSAGHLSRIENGSPASIPLALRLEAETAGEVSADSLLTDDDAALLASHRRLAAVQPEDAAA
jgi:transcriptional regulator with XRE-family HTH domain